MCVKGEGQIPCSNTKGCFKLMWWRQSGQVSSALLLPPTCPCGWATCYKSTVHFFLYSAQYLQSYFLHAPCKLRILVGGGRINWDTAVKPIFFYRTFLPDGQSSSNKSSSRSLKEKRQHTIRARQEGSHVSIYTQINSSGECPPESTERKYI